MMIGPSAPNGPPVPIEIGGGKRFEQRDFRLNPAAPDQDRLERLRNAVAANFFRAVARHQPDDQ